VDNFKVLHLIDSGGFFGAEQMLLDLIIAQRSLGIEAVLGSIAEPGLAMKAIENKAQEYNVPYVRFDLVNRPSFHSGQILIDYLQHNSFQLAHSHGYKASILFAMKPFFLRRFPVIATVHGYTSRSFNKMFIFQLVDRLARLFLRANVYVSGRYTVKRRVLGYHASIPNGLGPEQQNWQADADLSAYLQQYKVLGSVGRFSPEKGFDILIDAFSELAKNDDELRLLLLGDGGLKSELQAQIDRLALHDKVWMAGYRDNAAGYIKDFTLFVNSSHTEGLPITLLEAMRGQTPIVASAVGGIPVLLEGGSLGTLVPAGDKQALTSAMVAGLSEQAIAMAQEAKQAFEAEYRREIMGQRYIDLYRKVLD